MLPPTMPHKYFMTHFYLKCVDLTWNDRTQRYGGPLRMSDQLNAGAISRGNTNMKDKIS